MLAVVVTFVYGVEHWRRRAAARASSHEQARFHAVLTCLLGDDGVRLAYRPGEARRRLRALAMSTSLTPSPTWVDRCVPLLRDLAVHAPEVDVTRDPRAAPTAVARHARDLALALARVGLVWQIRAGDPETDMEHVAEVLTRTATELDLASVAPTRDTLKGPRAPHPQPPVQMLTLTHGGLRPLPVGTTERVLVGAPLPLLSSVRVREGALEAEPVANEDAIWWRVVPGGVVRLVPRDAQSARDALAPVSLDSHEGTLGEGRIAAPPEGTDPRAVALDAVVQGRALWLAESVRGNGAVLARLPLRGASAEHTTAARLSTVPAGDREAARVDDEVAVAIDGRDVVAAYTDHLRATGLVEVRVVRARGGERATVRPVPPDGEAWQLRGQRPGVALCAAQGATWVFAAARDEWRAGVLRDGRVVDVGRFVRAGGRRYDEVLTVRCGRQGVMVYGREMPRSSPMLRCVVGASPRCEALPALPSPQPGDLAPFATVNAHGTSRAHPEWPLSLALSARGAVVAVRVAGTIAAVARLPAGALAWEPEHVVFDAAADEARTTLSGAELYADGLHTLLVLSTATALRATRSDDDGVTWRSP
jgi:hypothetical protein